MTSPPTAPTPLRWPLLRAIVGGASALDLERLYLVDRAQAEAFVAAYGFDWADPDHRRELEGIRQRALTFLRDELLNPGEAPPRWLTEERDLPGLLVAVSDAEPTPRRAWCCALLRLMHVVAHTHSHLEERYGEPIREQITARFHAHVHDDDGQLRLGRGPDAVPLMGFRIKSAKPSASLIMKLIHKPENVATDIFDRVGARFVTASRFDALRVIRYLRAHNVVMFANIKPTRSRNSLIDPRVMEEAIGAMQARYDQDGVVSLRDVAELRRRIEDSPLPAGPGSNDNPFSAVTYRSIQFTCRQLVRVDDGLGPPIRFFFPFEIQVLDQASYAESRSGLASHEVYKARQRRAVRRRVLGPLVEAPSS